MRELILFSSSDQGQMWQQVATASPDQESFSFYAPGDGQYWFTVSVVDKEGNRQPPDIYKSPPSQKVEVDITRPTFRLFSVDRQDGEVVVNWEIQEEHLDWNAFKLEYRSADGSESAPWTPITFNAAASGQASFRPTGLMGLKVRMQAQDMAGNVASSEKDLPGELSPARMPADLTGSPAPAPVPRSSFPVTPMPAPGPFAGATTEQPASYSAPPNGFAPAPALPPTTQYQTPSYPPPPNSNPPVPGYPPPPGGATVPTYPVAPAVDSGPRAIATSGGSSGFSPPISGPVGAGTAPGQPPLQVTNLKRIGLDFEVTREGPSRVGSIELYISPDSGGRTWNWKLHVDHKDLDSPIPVELPHEGVFGFRMVMRSGAGLSKGPPQPTDPPELRIEYDSTAPWAQLYEPKPDPQKPNVLILTWAATDRNLAANPVSVEWSLDPRAGGWRAIGGPDMPNSGRYNWEVTGDVPHRVYLRLLVRDTAGNITQAVSHEPILVDLYKPEGRLMGIVGTLQQP
jgi:hypothetical protein